MPYNRAPPRRDEKKDKKEIEKEVEKQQQQLLWLQTLAVGPGGRALAGLFLHFARHRDVRRHARPHDGANRERGQQQPRGHRCCGGAHGVRSACGSS